MLIQFQTSRCLDIESFSECEEKIPAVISKHDGSYAAQGKIPTVLEVDWKPDRLVVIEFPLRDDSKAFLAGPEVRSVCYSASSDYKQVAAGRWYGMNTVV